MKLRSVATRDGPRQGRARGSDRGSDRSDLTGGPSDTVARHLAGIILGKPQKNYSKLNFSRVAVLLRCRWSGALPPGVQCLSTDDTDDRPTEGTPGQHH